MLRLFLRELKVDEFVRENFFRIQNFVRNDPINKGNFVFKDYTLGTLTEELIPHGLRFTPSDVIQLSVRNVDTAVVTWHFDKFTDEDIVVSTSAPCRVRLYLGRYLER